MTFECFREGKTMKKLSCFLGVLAVVFVIAGPAGAGPIPPSPSPVPSAGESDLLSATAPPDNINVDWMVFQLGVGNAFGAPAGSYAYLYQVENTQPALGTEINSLSITIPWGTGSVISASSLAGDNLDAATLYHAGHTVVGEEEGFTFPPSPAITPILATDDGFTITWTFSDLRPGYQSDTLFFLSSMPPTYGNAVAQNSSPPSPWVGVLRDESGALLPPEDRTGDPVPIPIPEPGTLLLLALGLLGLGFLSERKKLH